jgi:hypothetical protein
MKIKIFMQSVFVFVALTMNSCNNNSDTSRRDDSAVTSEKTKLKINSAYRIKRDATYVDLSTSKKVVLKEDTVNHIIRDANTGFPVPFFIDIDTNDTVDEHGRIVNNALLPGENGKWKLDEGKLKKVD